MNTLQERADRLVRNEVYVCLSSLVSTLAKGAFDVGSKAKDLYGLCEQAAELCSPVLDYEEAATQAGWWKSGIVWANGRDTRTSAEEIGEVFGIDPYEREIYEHWSISQSLADDLAALGERIDTDFAGMCVWGRTTTGQGIAQDGIIRQVLEMHDARLKAMEEDWKQHERTVSA